MNNGHQKLSADLAQALVEKLKAPEVRELFDRIKAAGEEDLGTFEVVITTENLDRYQEVISLDGWELDHYRANPVVLWGHDHDELIGMCTDLTITDGKMIAKGMFAPTDDAQEKRRMYDLGFLRATSVGFIEKERQGNLITKAELLEFSFVSVPANPYALTLAMEKNLNVNELVTKGIMFVEKTTEDEVVPEEEQEDPGSETGLEQPKERSFSTKQLTPVVASLKEVLVVLEALCTDAKSLEDDEPTGTEEELSEEEKAVQEFDRKRKVLQEAATAIGDVLAESRRAIEARQ